MMGLDNPLHIAFLLILLLLVFGAKRLPEMGRSLGSGLRGFKESLGGDTAQHSVTAPQQAEIHQVPVHQVPAHQAPAHAGVAATAGQSVTAAVASIEEPGVSSAA